MIFFWNREEVYLGTSLQKFSEIRDKLVQNGIRYTYRLVSQSPTPHKHRYDNKLYYLYVHQKDYEQACFVITK